MYEEDEDFNDIYKVHVDMIEKYYTKFSNILIQDGYFFKGGLIFVPRWRLVKCIGRKNP